MAAMNRTMVGALCCVAVAAAVTGCVRIVAGSAAVIDSDSRRNAVLELNPLSQLLLDPSRWPAAFPPRTLSPSEAQAVFAAIDGVPPGGRVRPPECQPPQPREVAAVEGMRDDTALRVVLARGVGPLGVRRDQVARCGSFSVSSDAGPLSEVDIEMMPPPVIDVDDAFAFDQTQIGSTTTGALVLVGQVGEVRVIAEASGSSGELDTAALDEVFTSQVQSLRRAG
jgi:hypothetical protein